MTEEITLQQLEAKLKRLEAERELIIRWIALKKGEVVPATGGYTRFW